MTFSFFDVNLEFFLGGKFSENMSYIRHKMLFVLYKTRISLCPMQPVGLRYRNS